MSEQPAKCAKCLDGKIDDAECNHWADRLPVECTKCLDGEIDAGCNHWAVKLFFRLADVVLWLGPAIQWLLLPVMGLWRWFLTPRFFRRVILEEFSPGQVAALLCLHLLMTEGLLALSAALLTSIRAPVSVFFLVLCGCDLLMIVALAMTKGPPKPRKDPTVPSKGPYR